jgi:hypothetical protein
VTAAKYVTDSSCELIPNVTDVGETVVFADVIVGVAFSKIQVKLPAL